MATLLAGRCTTLDVHPLSFAEYLEFWKARRDALDGYVLSKETITLRAADPKEYLLCQAADYICTIELTRCNSAPGTMVFTK